MASEPSCLVKNLSQYIDLDESEEEIVATLERDEREFDNKQVVRSRGDRVEHLHAVKTGWLFTSTTLPDGRRQIIRVYVPGDVIGLCDLGYRFATHDITCCTDAVLCPFPKTALRPALSDAPRLTALLLSLTAREQVMTVDMQRASSRMNARDRVLYLLLQMLSRLRVTIDENLDRYDLPLNQTQLGDAIGLTNVSVSKAIGELERTGCLSREGTTIVLNEPAASMRKIDFSDRYEHVDTSWFPD